MRVLACTAGATGSCADGGVVSLAWAPQSPVLLAAAAAALTFLLSLALPFAVKPWLARLGVMDVPNERSSHERPVLRGLGLAVLIALVVGGAVGALLLSSATAGSRTDPAALTTTSFAQAGTLAVVLVGSLAAGALGFAEDLRGLSVKARSVCLLLIGVAVPAGLLLLRRLDSGTVSFGFVAGDFIATPLPTWALLALIPYAVLFISSYINVANFMDGLNGISGFHGVVAGIAFAAAGALANLPWLLVVGAVLAAAFAGFLPWNLTRPGAFLGDVGSYLLGGAVAITSFAAFVAGVPILATIGPMILYFGDVGVTLVKRVRAGHKWDEPHKEHVYQRVQQLGYTHVQASGMVAGLSLVASVLGLASFFTQLWGTLALLVAGLAVLALYLALPRLLPRRGR